VIKIILYPDSFSLPIDFGALSQNMPMVRFSGRQQFLSLLPTILIGNVMAITRSKPLEVRSYFVHRKMTVAPDQRVHILLDVAYIPFPIVIKNLNNEPSILSTLSGKKAHIIEKIVADYSLQEMVSMISAPEYGVEKFFLIKEFEEATGGKYKNVVIHKMPKITQALVCALRVPDNTLVKIKGSAVKEAPGVREKRVFNTLLRNITELSLPEVLRLYPRIHDVIVQKHYVELVDSLMLMNPNLDDSILKLAQDAGSKIIHDSVLKNAMKQAIQDNNREFLHKILTHGFSVDTDLGGGETALIRAAGEGKLLFVQELLDAGADINKKNKDGQTALDIAKELQEKEVIAELQRRIK
jgi:hypothetical protein